MSGIDMSEIILLVIVFTIGVGGFIWAATKEEDKN